MRNIFHIPTSKLPAIAALALVGIMASCGSEDDPVLDYDDPTNYFEPADSATDEISALRRQFFESYGSYLLFNDTLQHYSLGTDINGTERFFTERLAVNYKVGNTSTYSDPYTYTLFKTAEDKKKALEYLETYILPHLSKKISPFSWLLVNRITYSNSDYSTVDNTVSAVCGQRANVLALYALASLKTEAQKQQLVIRHLSTIISNVSENYSDAFADFAAISQAYYGASLSPLDGMTTTQTLRTRGFLRLGSSSYYYPSQEYDMSAYTSLVLSYSEETIERTYASYPLIIEKAKLFKQCLINLGFTF